MIHWGTKILKSGLILSELSYTNVRLERVLNFLQTKAVLPSHLQRAHVRRKCDFLGGRFCARLALSMYHQQPAFSLSVRSGPKGEPLWPGKIVGSISHTGSHAAAVVGDRHLHRGVGLDRESLVNLSLRDVRRHVFYKKQDQSFFKRSRLSASHYQIFVFSAKESLYKALFPLVRVYFGFQDAALTSVDSESRTFTLELKKDLSSEWTKGTELQGSFRRTGDHLETLIYIPRN